MKFAVIAETSRRARGDRAAAREDRTARGGPRRRPAGRARDRHRLPLGRRPSGQARPRLGHAPEARCRRRPAESPTVELAEVDAVLDGDRAHQRQGVRRRQAAAAAGPAGPAHRGRAAIPRRSARRASCARARSRAWWSRPSPGPPADRPRRGAARLHDGREIWPRSPRAALGGGHRAASPAFAVRLFQPVLPMLAGSAEDVAEALARAGRGRGGVQARRRAGPDPPAGRRGPGLLPPPQRGDRRRAGAGGGGARRSRRAR